MRKAGGTVKSQLFNKHASIHLQDDELRPGLSTMKFQAILQEERALQSAINSLHGEVSQLKALASMQREAVHPFSPNACQNV